MDSQVDQAGLADIGGDKLGGDLYGGQKQSQIACGELSEPDLIRQDMAIVWVGRD